MSTKTLGQRLRQARQKLGLDLAQAASATRIRRFYLEALENGEFDRLPSPVQVRGFLRAYAAFLELDADELLSLLEPAPSAEPEDTEEEKTVGADEGPAQEDRSGDFNEIGAILRNRRTLLDLNYTEIEEQIHIPEHYLRYMEDGDFERFPSPTQARGMLDNYAEFLGLERGELLQRYADILQNRFQAQRVARRPNLPLPKPNLDLSQLRQLKLPPWTKRVFSPDLFVGVLFTLGLLVFFIWGIGRIAAIRAGATLEPTAPPLSEAELGANTSETPTATLIPESVQASSQPTEGTPAEIVDVPGNPNGVNLQLLASRHVWVRVTVDGKVAYEGRLAPQVPQSFSGQDEVLLYTGDAGSLQAFLNGDNLGVLGVEGEVVDLVFTRQGQATPTPTSTPTPAEDTPTPSNTPQPTATSGS